MASEERRQCGYRKLGGLYLVSGPLALGCHRFPLPLDVCPTRGWTWVGRELLLPDCEICSPSEKLPEQVGLLWVGASFYPTADDFLREAFTQGISRRIRFVPRRFLLGETWVLLAHPRAIQDGDAECARAGIFAVFKPERIEKIVSNKECTDEARTKAAERGITLVVIDENDPDHTGNVHDDAREWCAYENAGQQRLPTL